MDDGEWSSSWPAINTDSSPQTRRGGAKRRGGVDQEIDFLEPTAPPPHLLMVHPARTKAGSLLASMLERTGWSHPDVSFKA